MMSFKVADLVAYVKGHPSLIGKTGVVDSVHRDNMYTICVENAPIMERYWRVTGYDIVRAHCKTKDKKENNDMVLLEIYKTKKIEKLLVDRNKAIEKIKDSDIEYKSLKMTIDALTPKQLTCLSVDLSYYEFDADIEDKIHNKSKEYDNKKHTIMDLISEIRAQLDMCDTYEQKQNILKAYKVIDDQGKLL
jgi:predicted RNase H-like nuclease (RuvC/YqgF family)